jgi:hypothetical protein
LPNPAARCNLTTNVGLHIRDLAIPLSINHGKSWRASLINGKTVFRLLIEILAFFIESLHSGAMINKARKYFIQKSNHG